MPQVSLRKHLGRIAFTVLRANNITGRTHGAIRWMLTEGSTLLHVWRTQPLKQGRDAQRKALRGEMSPFPCISLISYSWVTVPTDVNTKHQNHNRGNRLFPTFISSSISESFRSRARFSCLQGFITEMVRGVYKKNKACSLLKKSKSLAFLWEPSPKSTSEHCTARSRADGRGSRPCAGAHFAPTREVEHSSQVHSNLTSGSVKTQPDTTA